MFTQLAEPYHCRPATAPTAMAPTKLALALDWLPNAASHAGFYVAQAQGLYEKHGLDVTIISPHSGEEAGRATAQWLAAGLPLLLRWRSRL